MSIIASCFNCDSAYYAELASITYGKRTAGDLESVLGAGYGAIQDCGGFFAQLNLEYAALSFLFSGLNNISVEHIIYG